MPQYQVPQFIDVEDKVFGPLTIKQFLYIGAGAVPVVLIYMFFKGWVLFLFGVPIILFVLALAFYKPNGVPFPKVVKNFMKYALSDKLYLWKKRSATGSVLPNIEALQNIAPPHPLQPRVSYVIPPKRNRQATSLEDLAVSLDIPTPKEDIDL